MIFWLGIVSPIELIYILNYGNEIIWNNSNIRVEDITIMFKNWQQSGIKYVKDLFDTDGQSLIHLQPLKNSLTYHRPTPHLEWYT